MLRRVSLFHWSYHVQYSEEDIHVDALSIIILVVRT